MSYVVFALIVLAAFALVAIPLARAHRRNASSDRDDETQALPDSAQSEPDREPEGHP